MQTTLRLLIIVGLAVWGFLLLIKYQPNSPWNIARQNIDDATKSERCAEFNHDLADLEGARRMSYGDRAKQFVSGCW